jgi:hypothetical protein
MKNSQPAISSEARTASFPRDLWAEKSLSGRLAQRRLKFESFQVTAKRGTEFRILQSDFNGCF